MSIVKRVCEQLIIVFWLCFDHNRFGWQSFINLWFIDKEVFHYESQRVKNEYLFNVAYEDKIKAFLKNAKVNIEALLGVCNEILLLL